MTSGVSNPTETSGPLILIADSNLEHAEFLKKSLIEEVKMESSNLMIASDGIQAFMTIRSTLKIHQPSLVNPLKLIILDYSLPSLNCFQIVRQNLPLLVKKFNKVPTIVIISDDGANEEECLREADYFLRKPVDVKVLLKIIHDIN
jgi:CheY-like chemotaxis protein